MRSPDRLDGGHTQRALKLYVPERAQLLQRQDVNHSKGHLFLSFDGRPRHVQRPSRTTTPRSAASSANSRSLVELGNLARLAKGCGGLTARCGSERVSGLSPPKRRREPAGPDPDDEAIDDARHLREQGHP